MTDPIKFCWEDTGWDWVANDLPCPTISGFNYSIDAGLIRTQLDGGFWRQRRRYTHRPHAMELRWVLTAANLQTVQEAIDTYGYDGVYLPLITGANGFPQPLRHLVRMTGNINVSPAGARNVWELTVTAEMQDFDPACMVAANCDIFQECLNNVSFTQVAISQATWDAIDAAWEDSTYWGNPNP